jgi:hypothetical protein
METKLKLDFLEMPLDLIIMEEKEDGTRVKEKSIELKVKDFVEVFNRVPSEVKALTGHDLTLKNYHQHQRCFLDLHFGYIPETNTYINAFFVCDGDIGDLVLTELVKQNLK